MAQRIDDNLISELKKKDVLSGRAYIIVYDDKDAGFIVRKSTAGVITYAIEFKDNKDKRKTIKIGNGNMKPAIARCVASSLLKQKLKDRRLKTLNVNELVELVVNEEPVGIVERDVADIASSFFNNSQNEKIVAKDVKVKPETSEVVLNNENEQEVFFNKESCDSKVGVNDESAGLMKAVFESQIEPLAEGMFLTNGIGSDSDHAFRLSIFNQLKEDDVVNYAKEYKSVYLNSKDDFEEHQQGRAVTVANKHLRSLVKKKEAPVTLKEVVVINISDKIKEKESIIANRM